MAKQRRLELQGITPAGTLRFPKLDPAAPDTKYKPGGQWKAPLILEGEAAQAQKQKIDAFYAEAYAKCLDMEQKRAAFEETEPPTELKIAEFNLPYRPVIDRDTKEEVEGALEFSHNKLASGVYGKQHKKAGQTWHGKLLVSDAKNQPVTKPVWGGTTAKVAFTLGYFYTALGFGVNCRLEAVRVLDLVSQGERTAASLFGDEEEGYSDAGEAPDDFQERFSGDDEQSDVGEKEGTGAGADF